MDTSPSPQGESCESPVNHLWIRTYQTSDRWTDWPRWTRAAVTGPVTYPDRFGAVGTAWAPVVPLYVCVPL
jgi:hypothetical protein